MRSFRLIGIQFAVILSAAAIAFASSNAGRVGEKYDKSFPLNPGGKVSLQNVNGDLKVVTWEKNEVRVQAEKYADDEDALARLKINVDASKDMIAIDTEYPVSHGDKHGHGVSVDYILTVPKNANLEKVSIVNGRVEITGVAGDVEASTVNGTVETSGLGGRCDLSTVNGKVEAGFTAISRSADIRLNTVNGSLTVRLPGHPNVSIKAATTTGRISNEFGLESSAELNEGSFVRVGDRLHAKLGNGSALLRLNAVNGNISILKSETEN